MINYNSSTYVKGVFMFPDWDKSEEMIGWSMMNHLAYRVPIQAMDFTYCLSIL